MAIYFSFGMALLTAATAVAASCPDGKTSCGSPASRMVWYYQCQFYSFGPTVGTVNPGLFKWNYIGKIEFQRPAASSVDTPFAPVEDPFFDKKFGKTPVPKVAGKCAAFEDRSQYFCKEAVINNASVPCSGELLGATVDFVARETPAN